jgi:hypothetical protein
MKAIKHNNSFVYSEEHEWVISELSEDRNTLTLLDGVGRFSGELSWATI